MLFLYSFVSKIFPLLQRIASYFNAKIKARYLILRNQVLPSDTDLILIHCASLGESEMAMPIIYSLLNNSSFTIVVSFFSSSGYTDFKETNRVKKVYLPVDTKKNAHSFFNTLKPKAFIIVKYEFWLHHILAAQTLNIPCFLINGIFNPKHFIFKWYGNPWLKAINAFAFLYLQNYETNKKIVHLLSAPLKLVGDLRFNRVLQNAEEAQEITRIKNWSNTNKKILILGSSWQEEETLVLKILPQIQTSFKLIIAPHNIKKNKINDLKIAFDAELFTDPNLNKNTLILNSIGHLKYAYQYANIAFIGGGFKTGLHNILEPLAFGIPVIFGPLNYKFPEAELTKLHAFGFEITNELELLSVLNSYTEKANEITAFAFNHKVDDLAICKAIIETISFRQNTI